MSTTKTSRAKALKRPVKKATNPQARGSRKPNYLTLMPHAPLPGGVFAGFIYDRGFPEILIAGPEYSGEGDWDAVVAWAKGLNVDGCSDFFIPLRPHGRILQANVPTLFQPSWYWLGEQRASYSAFAWDQYFGDGGQGSWGKGGKLRARAVRRSPI